MTDNNFIESCFWADVERRRNNLKDMIRKKDSEIKCLKFLVNKLIDNVDESKYFDLYGYILDNYPECENKRFLEVTRNPYAKYEYYDK